MTSDRAAQHGSGADPHGIIEPPPIVAAETLVAPPKVSSSVTLEPPPVVRPTDNGKSVQAGKARHVAVPVAAVPLGTIVKSVAVKIDDEPPQSHWYDLLGDSKLRSSWLTSLVFNAVMLLVLGLLMVEQKPPTGLAPLLASIEREIPQQLNESLPVQPIVRLESPVTSGEPAVSRELLGAPSTGEVQRALRQQAMPMQAPFGMESLSRKGLLQSVSRAGSPGELLAGRSPGSRAALVKDGGGTQQSEDAVERGLRWLQAHQRKDGSWHFDHRGACSGICRDPGTHGSTTGATALALMPFFGAGYTHVADSNYKETVKLGLYYLCDRLKQTPHGGDLQEGTMYAQGLSAIVICEAYAMTHDRSLEGYAQSAIDYILYAQDKRGGGWRYFPGQAGDMTVTGWQLMALKSAQMAYLRVPHQAIVDATRFLDSLQTEGGAGYGYTSNKKEPTTTSVGLLSRMYTGWSHDHPGLVRGVQYLSLDGPSQDNMYFNYYATNVMHHYGGPQWDEWNEHMREYLIATQSRQGHESGSWYFDGGQAHAGGRVLNTALSVLTLEVYYRYLPLFGQNAADGSF